jgi:hypothetical protein
MSVLAISTKHCEKQLRYKPNFVFNCGEDVVPLAPELLDERHWPEVHGAPGD